MRLTTLALAAILLTGCVNYQPGFRFGFSASHHCVEDEHFSSRGDPAGLDLDAELEEGWGVVGAFDVIGRIDPNHPRWGKKLKGMFAGVRFDVSHTEIDRGDITSTWEPHDHSHHKRASEKPREPELLETDIEAGYEQVTIAPLFGYEWDVGRVYTGAGPSLTFLEARQDYYGAGSESDTSLGVLYFLGGELDLGDSPVYLFGEYRFTHFEPSLYYANGSKFSSEVDAHAVAFGLGARW